MDYVTKIALKVLKENGFFPFNYNYLLFQLTVVLAVIIIEICVVGWQKSSFKKILEFDKSTRSDVIAYLIEAFNLYNIISLTLSLGTCYYLVGIIQNQCHFNLHIKNQYLQFGVIFLFSDLKTYVAHRCFHAVGPLWKLHVFHHSANQFTILTRTRGHFLETEISRFFDVIPFAIFGAPVLSYFTLKVILEFLFMMQHSALKSNWGFIGKYIIVSPAAHRLHHSEDEKHYNKNFGAVFIFWDRLFGTYHPPVKNIRIGIINNNYNKKGFIHDIIECQIQFLKETIESVNRMIKRIKN